MLTLALAAESSATTTALTTAIATVIAAAIAAVAAIATQRSSAAAAVRNQSISSRTDIEKEAFERAKGFYTDTIDRQSVEIQGLETDVGTLRGRVTALEAELAEERSLREADRHTTRQLRDELEIARRALRLKYPDEE